MVYYFAGHITPTTHTFSFGPIKFHTPKNEESGRIDVECVVRSGSAEVKLEPDEETIASAYGDVLSLLVVAEHVMQQYLDIYNFSHGCRYRVHLEYCRNTLEEEYLPFSPYTDYLLERSNPEAEFERIQRIYSANVQNNWYIAKILTDLNHAQIHVNETGLFCYRAFETMAKFFAPTMIGGVEKGDWEAMREALDIERAPLDRVKLFADRARHGSLSPMPASVRREVLLITWDVTEKFLSFAEAGFGGRKSSLEYDLDSGGVIEKLHDA